MRQSNPLRKLRTAIMIRSALPIAWSTGALLAATLVGSPATAQLLMPPTSPASTQNPPTEQATTATQTKPDSASVSSTTPALPSSAHTKQSRAYLAEAEKALSAESINIAVQKYSEALLFGQDVPEMKDSFESFRKAILERGVSEEQLDQAVKVYQAAFVKENRSSQSLRSEAPSAKPTMLAQQGTQPLPATGPTPANPLRDQAAALAAQAKMAMDRNDLQTAGALLQRAGSLNVPGTEFAAGQISPASVAAELQARVNDSAVVPAGGTIPAGGVSTGVYRPQSDASNVAPASVETAAAESPALAEDGDTLYRNGIDALAAGNREKALMLFRRAWQKERELDPAVRAQLKDKLTLLQTPDRLPANSDSSPLDAAQQQMLLQKQRLFREISGEIASAEAMVNEDPMLALERLKALRQRVSQTNVEGKSRKAYLTMVDRVVANVQAYVDSNRAEIDQAIKNRDIREANEQSLAIQAKLDAEIQNMVNQYNELIRQQNFAGAVVIASNVRDLVPDSEIGAVLYRQAKLQQRVYEQELLTERKEAGFVDALNAVEASAVPFDDEIPLQWTPASDWKVLSDRRLLSQEDNTMSAEERAIRRQLELPVSFSFNNTPISNVIAELNSLLPFYVNLDPVGLTAEGLTSDQRINLDLRGQEISLKSALKLMFEPLGLRYQVDEEYLTITSASQQTRRSVRATYTVKDLVIPIPNFVNDYNSGLAGALRSAYLNQGRSLLVNTNAPINGVANQNNSQYASIDPNNQVLGQLNGPGGFGNPAAGGGFGLSPQGGPFGGANPFGGGVSGGNRPALGGASIQDFNRLIQLIQSVVESNWDTDGGTDTIVPEFNTLSIVVRAPQETQENIRDLLSQLRALQNLQVTIEVRFITLSDAFFERVGIDFDIGIDDNVDDIPPEDQGPSVSIGLDPGPGFGVPTADLDIQFTNNFLGSTIPPFGGFDADAVGRFGVAILSDIELFFLLEAAQGDTRNNVLQAPKVTMFDGQTASVIDNAQVPFVVGLTPVVGDFAVAQQPIIVVLNDGTQLNVQSVVSPDKRFVRMTLSPEFTTISNEDNTFTFEGTQTSSTGSTVFDPVGNPLGLRDDEELITTGSTVQLPTLGTTAVLTTVTVPDGGTILLGGIKRLSEGRTERGLPVLSKLPYINRLFKNVGIGRTTDTLMMTVSPRIIIPEEEEANVLGQAISP